MSILPLQAQAYQFILALFPTINQLSVGTARKSTVAGYMDLNLDCLSYENGEIEIALSHYYEQNGDLIADPDMQITLYIDAQQAVVNSYQDTYSYTRIEEHPSDQEIRKRHQLTQFLVQWLTNCIDQGHSFK